MCSFLALFTDVDFNKSRQNYYLKQYKMRMENVTEEVKDRKTNQFYYLILYGGCSCEIITDEVYEAALSNVLKEMVASGEASCILYEDTGEKENMCEDLQKMIDISSCIEISVDDFLAILYRNYVSLNTVYKFVEDT